MSTDKIKQYAYKLYANSRWFDSACEDFLKDLLPENMHDVMYENLHNFITGRYDDQIDYDFARFIQSFIKMCGFDDRELPQFDRFEKDNNPINSVHVIHGHNELYRFEIRFRYRIKYDSYEIRFYRNNGGEHFLTLKSYLDRSGSTDTIERYSQLVKDCYDDCCGTEKVFQIGASTGFPRKYGYYVIVTGNAYFCYFRHTETLESGEDFFDFYNKIK